MTGHKVTMWMRGVRGQEKGWICLHWRAGVLLGRRVYDITATKSSEYWHLPKHIPVPLIHWLEKESALDSTLVLSASPPAAEWHVYCFRWNCFPKALFSSSEYLMTSFENAPASSHRHTENTIPLLQCVQSVSFASPLPPSSKWF